MAQYVPTVWVDDDGSNAVGTVFNAARMNKLEQGILGAGVVPNGGAANQILQKRSAADQDQGWADIFTDPAFQRHDNLGAAGQVGPSNAPWVYNIASAPYLDLTPGQWRIDGGVMVSSNPQDYVMLALYNETDAVVIPGSSGPAVFAGTAAPYASVYLSTVVNVAKNVRLRLYVMPNGASAQTAIAAGGKPTAQMIAHRVTPGLGPQGPKGDKGDASNAAVVMDAWRPVGAVGQAQFNGMWKNKFANNLYEYGAAVRKDPLGIARLRGTVTGGAAFTNIFQLLPADCPPKNVRCPIVLYDGTTGFVGGAYLYIGHDGWVSVAPWFVDSAPTAYVELDGAWWDTEQANMPVGPAGAKGADGQGFANAQLTWDWNTAIAPGTYRSGTSADDPLHPATTNGPPSPDPLNPTMAIGFVTASGLGDIEQFAYVLDQAYSRIYTGGAWQGWLPFLRPGKLTTASTIGGTPYDGEIRFFQDATLKALGVCWQFRYNAGSASPYKWEFVGGGKWSVDTTPNVNCAANAQLFGNPSYTLPLNGDFSISWGARMFNDTSPYWGEAGYGMEWLRGGARQIGVDYIDSWSAVTPTQAFSITPHLMRSKRFNALAPADVIRSYYTSAGAEAIFANIWMEVVPIRVSGI